MADPIEKTEDLAVEAEQVEDHERRRQLARLALGGGRAAHVHALLEHPEVRQPAAVERDHLAVHEHVADHPEVTAAYTVAGDASAVLHVRARDTEHLERTLERLRDAPGVTRTQTQVVLSTLFERPVS